MPVLFPDQAAVPPDVIEQSAELPLTEHIAVYAGYFNGDTPRVNGTFDIAGFWFGFGKRPDTGKCGHKNTGPLPVD